MKLEGFQDECWQNGGFQLSHPDPYTIEDF